MADRTTYMQPRKKPSQPVFTLRNFLVVTLFTGIIIGQQWALYVRSEGVSTADTTIQVRFSPGGKCLQLIEETLAAAQHTILVQAYSFTLPAIAAALIAAHQRGVAVSVLVDRSQLYTKYTQIYALLEAGIPVAIDEVPGIAHNKVMLIDDAYVLTGSFNWTQAAVTRNAENLLCIKDVAIHQAYKAYWHQRAKKSKPVLPKQIHQPLEKE